VCCSALQCVAECVVSDCVYKQDLLAPLTGALQCVAACVAVRCNVLQRLLSRTVSINKIFWLRSLVRCSVLQYFAVCCNLLPRVAACVAVCTFCNAYYNTHVDDLRKTPSVGNVCVAVCCSVLQCVAVCCNMLQRVAVCIFCTVFYDAQLYDYGVATMSRLLKIIGLFCKRAL